MEYGHVHTKAVADGLCLFRCHPFAHARLRWLARAKTSTKRQLFMGTTRTILPFYMKDIQGGGDIVQSGAKSITCQYLYIGVDAPRAPYPRYPLNVCVMLNSFVASFKPILQTVRICRRRSHAACVCVKCWCACVFGLALVYLRF